MRFCCALSPSGTWIAPSSSTTPTRANADAGTSFPTFQILRDRRETFSSVMAIAGARPLSLIDGDRREQVFAELVTADFFSIADVTLHLGRPLDRDIDRVVDPPSVAVLSHAFWQRRFGSDPTIVGKTIVLNGQPFVVDGGRQAGVHRDSTPKCPWICGSR